MSVCCIWYFRPRLPKAYGWVYERLTCLFIQLRFIKWIFSSGSSIEAKTYPDVTMLFSDIVGFTSICSTATPFMVISMLEILYKDFDEFCGFFDVYKVETIGDAYCVASGLHRAGIYDAHKVKKHNWISDRFYVIVLRMQVAWMALRMIDACSKHNTHDGQHIRVGNVWQIKISSYASGIFYR